MECPNVSPAECCVARFGWWETEWRRTSSRPVAGVIPHYGRLSAGMHDAVAWHGVGPEVQPLMVYTNKGAVHP